MAGAVMMMMDMMMLGDCCTPETPCKLGEGDCQQDVDCRDDLVKPARCTVYCVLSISDISYYPICTYIVLIEGLS